MNDLISIIVPIFNVELYIKQCIDSILSQTYKNIEIILIDDGSTDNCPAICDDYAQNDNRIKVIHKKNGGLSSARNAGLKLATGKFIGFVDSDDYIFPTMYQYLIDNMNDNVGIVSCQIYTDTVGQIDLFQCGDTLVEKKVIKSSDYLKDILFLKATFAAWNKLYRKSFIKGIHFEEGLNYEDVLFLYEIGKLISGESNYLILEMPERLYYYRIREGSICNNMDKPLFVDKIKVFKKIYIDLNSYNVDLAKSYLHFILPIVYDTYLSLKKQVFKSKYIESENDCIFFLSKLTIRSAFSIRNNNNKILVKFILLKYFRIRIKRFNIFKKQ